MLAEGPELRLGIVVLFESSIETPLPGVFEDIRPSQAVELVDPGLEDLRLGLGSRRSAPRPSAGSSRSGSGLAIADRRGRYCRPRRRRPRRRTPGKARTGPGRARRIARGGRSSSWLTGAGDGVTQGLHATPNRDQIAARVRAGHLLSGGYGADNPNIRPRNGFRWSTVARASPDPPVGHRPESSDRMIAGTLPDRVPTARSRQVSEFARIASRPWA